MALALLSPDFAYQRDLITQPVLILVALELLAGGLYLLVARAMSEAAHGRALLIWIIAVGAMMRAAMFISTPMLESDYNRYLWDGALVARGINPYAFAPSQIIEDDNDQVPPALHQLASESGPVISRINHRNLRTVYPPVAQAAFTLAHWVQPWSLFAWRLILLGFDTATLTLLFIILRSLKLSPLSLVVYWWNPVLIKETFNSAHLDVIVLPFVLGAVLLAIRGSHTRAAGALGLAMGAKIWPVVLLPVLFRPILTKPKKFIPALTVFGLLACALFFPVYATGFDQHSGFVVYGQRWEMNDGLFMLILWGTQILLKGLGLDPNDGQLAARLLVAVIVIGLIAWLTREKRNDGIELWETSVLILAVVFLLSPTQFPWYYVWLVPFLTIRPRLSLLLLTALLPLYYLRFYFAARGNVAIFDLGIVWLEYLPVWWLLIREWRARPRPLIPFEVPA